MIKCINQQQKTIMKNGSYSIRVVYRFPNQAFKSFKTFIDLCLMETKTLECSSIILPPQYRHVEAS